MATCHTFLPAVELGSLLLLTRPGPPTQPSPGQTLLDVFPARAPRVLTGSESGHPTPVDPTVTPACPVSGAALLVQEAAATYTNPALEKEAGGTLRLWALFPPEGNVHGRPVLSHADIPAKGSDNVRAAVLHDSMLHYVSQKNGKLYYGIVPVVASVVEGQPRIGFVVGKKVERVVIAEDHDSVVNDRPTLDVTANGTAIITYSYIHANNTRRSLAMAVVKLQNGVPVVVKSDRGFGPGVATDPDTDGTLPDGLLDYTGTARDPLYAEQVWFAQPVSGEDKREFWSGVINSQP